jgi:CBS domain-containing protein
LEHKGRDIWTIPPTATVFQAIQMMSEKNIGALPVMEGTKLVGIISERDCMSKVALHGKSSKETPVGDIMVKDLVTVGPDQTVSNCLEIIATLRMTIEQLNAYISGGYSA